MKVRLAYRIRSDAFLARILSTCGLTPVERGDRVPRDSALERGIRGCRLRGWETVEESQRRVSKGESMRAW